MGIILEQFEKLKEESLAERAAKYQGKTTIIHVGSATCEKAAGSDLILAEFQKLVEASGRQDILIKQVGCTGRCSKEPIVGVFTPQQIPIKYEKVTAAKVRDIFRQHILSGKPVTGLILDKKTSNLYERVVTFASLSTLSTGLADKWAALFSERLEAQGVGADSVRVFSGGCLGLYSAGQEKNRVGMMVYPDDVIYEFSQVEELDEIIQSHFIAGAPCAKRLVEVDPLIKRFFSLYGDVAFFNKQTRLTLRNSGIIDPEYVGDYIANDGFAALAHVLEKNDPKWVIDEVTRSGLRGRGGAGFPTGVKWNAAAVCDDPVKYVICNADEGDPGAYMDRSTLEGDPFSIIHGMALGAFAIGAHQGYLYVRAEYPLAIERLRIALEQCRQAHLIGPDILGSGFDFDLEIRLGAGAFVCGEETALIYSIEGKRGQPRLRPPFPAQSGLWGHPTVINNVETWANVPVIMRHGADWFSRIGTEKSKGTKVFALAGKIKNSGLVEVPMGATLREIIFDIGGGVAAGRTLKAIQTGGPSGGCLPASVVDTEVDYDQLAKAGSIMGSGGMIVLDDQDCMVATAKFFLEFTQDESCGKCVPCREGTLRMLEILKRIANGQGEMEDLEKLERLGQLIKKTSLCGLGQTAPNPVLSALRFFREEFVTHIVEKRCPTLKCPRLIQYAIDSAKCTGCGLCARRCPASCISGVTRKPHAIDASRCVRCGECFNACHFKAVVKQ